MRKLCEEFRHYIGQPIEVITESGFKYCGIDVEADDDGVVIVDKCGRLVRIESKHVESFIQPQMKLDRLCADNDCSCGRRDRNDCDNDSRNNEGCDCD